MKRILTSIIIVMSFFGFSCSSQTAIPDDELAQIFHDAFLANAYIYNGKMPIDSLQVYAPIFDRYGYTVEDVQYTIGSFSKRKSARLSDVVEEAIKLLDKEEEFYIKENAILDTIDVVARRHITRTLYTDSIATYFAERDSVDMRIEFDSIQPGEYIITFDYLIDSIDTNRSNYRAMTWYEAADDENNTKLGTTTLYLKKKYVSNYSRTLTVDTLTPKLVVKFIDTYEHVKKPHVTIRNIKVDYIAPIEVAIDSLYINSLNISLFTDDFFWTKTKDSLKLSAQ